MFNSILNSIKLNFTYYKNSRFTQYIYTNSIISNTIIIITIVILLLYIVSRYNLSLPLNLEYISYIFSFIMSLLFSMYLLPKIKDSNKKISFRNIVYYLILTIGTIIIILFLTILLAYFDLLGHIYAEGVSDDIGNSSSSQLPAIESNNNNSNADTSKSYSGSIDKEFADKTLSAMTQVATEAIGKAIPNMGAAAAGVTIGAAALKASQGGSPMVRAVSAFGGAVIGSAGAKTGLLVVDTVIKNKQILEDLNKGFIPSDKVPSPVDNPFINSPRELTSPLEDLLFYQFTLNILILFLIIIFLMLFLNAFVFKFNKTFILNFLEKLLPPKGNKWFKVFISNTTKYSDSSLKILFIVNSIILIYLIILNIFISYHLFINTESYIEVHNHIHSNESNFLLFLMFIKD